MHGALGSGSLTSLVLNGGELPQTEPLHNLGVLLQGEFLLEEQEAVVDRRAFAYLHVLCQLLSFLARVPALRLLRPRSAFRLLWCTLHRATIEKYSASTAAAE